MHDSISLSRKYFVTFIFNKKWPSIHEIASKIFKFFYKSKLFCANLMGVMLTIFYSFVKDRNYGMTYYYRKFIRVWHDTFLASKCIIPKEIFLFMCLKIRLNNLFNNKVIQKAKNVNLYINSWCFLYFSNFVVLWVFLILITKLNLIKRLKVK